MTKCLYSFQSHLAIKQKNVQHINYPFHKNITSLSLSNECGLTVLGHLPIANAQSLNLTNAMQNTVAWHDGQNLVSH